MHGQQYIKIPCGVASTSKPSNYKTDNVVERNNWARSCNHCCSGKAKNITYSDCVFVASGIQLAMRMPHAIICGLSGSTIFFQIISRMARFVGKKKSLIFSTCVWNTSHSKKNWAKSKMYIGLHLKYLLFLSDLSETWMSSADFRNILKYQISWISVQWEPSCSIRTDMTKLIVAFRNFEKARKNARVVIFSTVW